MSIFTQGARALARNAGKIIKGVKGSGQLIKKGIKGSGELINRGIKGSGQIVQNVKNLFKATPKPAGVVVEKVLNKGGVKNIKKITKITGKFDETLQTGLPSISDIPKTGFTRQVVKKADRLKIAKQKFKNM